MLLLRNRSVFDQLRALVLDPGPASAYGLKAAFNSFSYLHCASKQSIHTVLLILALYCTLKNLKENKFSLRFDKFKVLFSF